MILVGLEMDPLLDDALAFAHRLHSKPLCPIRGCSSLLLNEEAAVSWACHFTSFFQFPFRTGVGTRFSMVVLKDAPHGFLNFKDASEETLRYYARCTSMINQALHGPVPYAEVPKAEWVTWHPN